MIERPSPRTTSWVRPLAASATLLLLTGIGAACGSDDEPSTSSTTGQEQTTTSAAPGGSTTAGSQDSAGQTLNDIQECEIIDGTGTASGAVENLGEEPASYELTLGFIDDATGEELGRGTTEVGTVEPGGSGEWSIEVDGLADAEVTCTTKGLDATPAP